MNKPGKSLSLVIIFTLTINNLFAQINFYVSPNGSDKSNGTISTPFATLTKAKEAVKMAGLNMQSDAIVYLRGGTYKLSSTLTFNKENSGTNGHYVIYRNYPGERPIISGGLKVNNWVLYDRKKNIYRAKIPPGLYFRQIYVNDKRAIRARSIDGSGWSYNKIGYRCPPEVSRWKNIKDVEVVNEKDWIFGRGPVANVTGTQVTMQEPYWHDANLKEGGVDAPHWIENAYELLDSDGEWYLDKSVAMLYYKPRAGEVMNKAEVIVPKLEVLIKASNLENVKFEGVTFAYATWLYPNSNHGYPNLQADGLWGNDINQVPGNLIFDHSINLSFDSNIFTHLGVDGLQLFDGCKNNRIYNNVFRDISGSGISIGNVIKNKPSQFDLCKDNTIDNNYITDVALEFKSCVGIFVGYAENTFIKNNELCNLPYTAISVGWGWSHALSACRGNHIEYNFIHDYMKDLYDGAAIYTLSNQPNSTCSYNYIDNRNIGSKGYGWAAIYLDQGTEGYECKSNVINIKSEKSVPWIMMQALGSGTKNNSALDNYTTSEINKVGIENLLRRNQTIANGDWPTDALDVIKNAGRRHLNQ